MNDSYEYPKKLPNQLFRIKSRNDNKAKQRTSFDKSKQGMSVPIDAIKKKDLNKANKNSQGINKNNKSHKSIKSSSEKISNQKRNQPMFKQNVQVSCQTQEIENQSKSRSLSKDIVVSLQNPSKPTLQEYEQEFLLKWKAKQFISKLKKDREDTHKKMEMLRMEAEQKRQVKLRQIEEKYKAEKELQIIKRREQALHKLQQIKFKQQRRKEELLMKELHEKKNSIFEQRRSRSNNFDHQKVNQLHLILDRRAKSKSDFQNDSKKLQKQPIYARKSQVIKTEKQKKNKTDPNNYKNRLAINIKDVNKLQEHLYLSIDDEKMLQDIKMKLDQLSTLRSQKKSQNKQSQFKN